MVHQGLGIYLRLPQLKHNQCPIDPLSWAIPWTKPLSPVSSNSFPSNTVSDASSHIFTYAVTYPSEVAILNFCGLPQRHQHETHWNPDTYATDGPNVIQRKPCKPPTAIDPSTWFVVKGIFHPNIKIHYLLTTVLMEGWGKYLSIMGKEQYSQI